ncbi:MAG: bifunctional phosphopantothenoylcysteine decarboxylase/phosphopantothenate--cysteine ligase CoaBC [Chromatiales bacterium]|nr:bifunctional phosphopantothenoylcysteine decarboxylase/phosphopantothenate--cysteine ligase CoaBC [Chromatiales bacterium]
MRILLGVSGGIAAYKAAELVRTLRRAGHEVQVVMTAAAAEFIGPMTLQALSGHRVRGALFDAEAEAAMGHIELARWAEQVVIAPASADLIARLATGMANDLLTTLCLATRAPLLLAPAMNHVMWANDATRENVARLRARGALILDPDSGEQACGEVGPGRMPEPDAIVAAIASPRVGALAGVDAVITAGPTREPIDPVRFVSNRSSGRMGYALAEAARDAGAAVTLISGPVALPPPRGVERVSVETAAQMHAEALARCAGAGLLIAAAAVADYRPGVVAAQKLKKGAGTAALELESTPDIVAAITALDPRPFVVGFAAETENLVANARGKLERKGMDMIVANRVGPGVAGGFESEVNAVTVLWPGGETELSLQPKPELARRLIDLIARELHARNRA